MSRKPFDLTGKKFGRLTVLNWIPEPNEHGGHWACKCDCGNTSYVSTSDLRNGKSTSCGCYRSEFLSQKNFVHGESHTQLYHSWTGMKMRCTYPLNKEYPNYGGRGIQVCDDWKNSYVGFKAWAMKNGYQNGLEIDRIDVNKGYSPENCRWVNEKQQARNKRNNHFITYCGSTMTIAEASERYGIPDSIIRDRIMKLHWTVERAIEQPIRQLNKGE